MAVLAPMPRANDRTATTVKPMRLRDRRMASRRSATRRSILLLGSRGRVGWGAATHRTAMPEREILLRRPLAEGRLGAPLPNRRCFVIRHDSPRLPCASPPVTRPDSRSDNRDTPTHSPRPRKSRLGPPLRRIDHERVARLQAAERTRRVARRKRHAHQVHRHRRSHHNPEVLQLRPAARLEARAERERRDLLPWDRGVRPHLLECARISTAG